jgi:hypothetical protein
MLAIIAAVLFGIALIMDLAEADVGLASSAVVTAGLLFVALHLAGVGSRIRTSGRWRARR